MEIEFNKPMKEKQLNGGIQRIWKFSNLFGASVIKHDFSYGHEDNLWELAVIKFEDDIEDLNEFTICYDTEITDDVVGDLSEKNVIELLEKIQLLK